MEFPKFPCVVKYQSIYDRQCTTTFIMYDESSAVVIEVGNNTHYEVGQVIDNRLSFADENEVTIITTPFEISIFAKKLAEFATMRERELQIYKNILNYGK